MSFTKAQKEAIDVVILELQAGRITPQNAERIKQLLLSENDDKKKWIADEILEDVKAQMDKAIDSVENKQLKALKDKRKKIEDAEEADKAGQPN